MTKGTVKSSESENKELSSCLDRYIIRYISRPNLQNEC